MNSNRQPDETVRSGAGLISRLRRGGIWIMLGRSMGMGIVFLTTIVLAKHLSEPEFANYIVTVSLVTLTSIVAMFGLNYLMCRFVSAYFAAESEPYARKTAIRIGATSIVSIFGLGLIFLATSGSIFGYFGAPDLTVYAWAIAAWIVLLSISQIIAETFRGLHHLFAASMLAGVSGGLFANAIMLAGIFYLISNGELTYGRIVILGPCSFALPLLIGSVWLFMAWPRKSSESVEQPTTPAEQPVELASRLPRNSFRAILREALPIMMLNLSAYGIDQSGQLLAKGFGQDLYVNTYESVWKLGCLIIVPLTMLGLASASTIAEQYSVQNRDVLQKVLRSISTISFLVSLPLFLLLVLFGGSIIGFVFQDAYTIGATSLIVIATVQMIRNWAGPCDVTLVMTGHQWWALLCFAITAPILCLGPWAVENHGVLGISIVVSSALLISRMSQYLVLRFKLKIKPHANLQLTFLSELFRLTTRFTTESAIVPKRLPEKVRH